LRWSIIRLIWLRDLRDQLRDRRTLFMIAVLPLLIYPILGIALLQFAFSFSARASKIGIVSDGGERRFPPAPDRAGARPTPAASVTAILAGATLSDGYAAAWLYETADRHSNYRPFAERDHFTVRDPATAHLDPRKQALLAGLLKIEWLDAKQLSRDPLGEREVDLVLETDPSFFEKLERFTQGDAEADVARPTIVLRGRPHDESSHQAYQRLVPLLHEWKKQLKTVRFVRKGLDARFDNPFDVKEPEGPEAGEQKVVDMMIRIFPFMLVMWSLAGALYPAVDLCAGEKERGTMETLLITPAGREEIVLGKFLTIWMFSFASAVLNLLSMGITTWNFNRALPGGGIQLAAVGWCVVLALPLSALFSAVSLAIGAYARSSKEGQYYLMPMFILTMPLIFLTLAPGVELNPFYSMVPVTGVALLMQRLMTAHTLAEVPWFYFIPVLVPVALYSGLALRWAIDQFQREEVLFREAERVDVRLWFRHVWRDKEPLPNTGQAFFCFALLLGLHWLSLGFVRNTSVLEHMSITLLAFVAMPVLMMALMLNTKPLDALAMKLPRWSELGLAVLLALLLLPPMAWLTGSVLDRFPGTAKLLDDAQPLIQVLKLIVDGGLGGSSWWYFVVFAVIAPVCQEMAFRGYILNGLMKRFRPRTSVLLASFLFAVYHMNVFMFLPLFFLGVILGLLRLRSKSVVPSIFFHMMFMTVLLALPSLLARLSSARPGSESLFWPATTGTCFAIALAILWWLYRKPYVDLAREEARMERERQAK
jgi:sodium transport system permease protein